VGRACRQARTPVGRDPAVLLANSESPESTSPGHHATQGSSCSAYNGVGDLSGGILEITVESSTRYFVRICTLAPMIIEVKRNAGLRVMIYRSKDHGTHSLRIKTTRSPFTSFHLWPLSCFQSISAFIFPYLAAKADAEPVQLFPRTDPLKGSGGEDYQQLMQS
jgi:hypothetical protein